MGIEEQFVERSRVYLTGNYLPKIRARLAMLPEEDVWWRPNAASNSVGHLLLHLSGNLRQWVVSGLGTAPDARRRHLEFEVVDRPGAEELIDWLASTVADADRVLKGLDVSILHAPLVIQGQSVTGFDALYATVEHFSTHTGQIIYITKVRTGKDLGFYEVQHGIAHPRWVPD